MRGIIRSGGTLDQEEVCDALLSRTGDARKAWQTE